MRFADFAHEMTVGSYKSAVMLIRQRNIDAIIRRMIEFDRDPGRRLQQVASWKEFDVRD